MKKLIDDKGRIFGKVNVIDFLIILTILILVPIFIVGQKLIRESYKDIDTFDAEKHSPTYAIKRACPNCGRPIIIEPMKGVPLSDILPYKTICPYCECPVTIEPDKGIKD